MNYNYKYRIYPTPEQKDILSSTLDTCRKLYNKLLEELKNGQGFTNNPTRSELQRRLTALKGEWDELNTIHSRVLHMVVYRLYTNINSVTPPHAHEPYIDRLRYKGEGWYKTFTYNQSGFDLNITGTWTDSVYLSKIGHIPIRYHREIPEDAEIKQVKVKRERNGEWFIVLGIEIEEDTIEPKTEDSTICIGAGINSFSVDSDGLSIESPSFDKEQHRIKKYRKNLQRKEKGSQNYAKELINLEDAKKSRDRKQRDFLHKLSDYYAREYDIVIIESRYLGRLNSAWWKFVDMLEYKAERAGTQVVSVSPDVDKEHRCPNCEISSNEQKWLRDNQCPSCHSNLNLESNRLKWIYEKGSEQIGLGQAEVKSVDTIASVEDITSSTSNVDESERTILA